jgi:hypothetical protein
MFPLEMLYEALYHSAENNFFQCQGCVSHEKMDRFILKNIKVNTHAYGIWSDTLHFKGVFGVPHHKVYMGVEIKLHIL